MTSFAIEIEGVHNLGIEEIWPAGYEAPENPTAEDVAQVIRDNCGTASALISEWNLPVTVTVNGVDAL